MSTHSVSLKINGSSVTAEVEDRTSLADFLRHGQRLTGTHLGCEHGVCVPAPCSLTDVPRDPA